MPGCPETMESAASKLAESRKILDEHDTGSKDLLAFVCFELGQVYEATASLSNASDAYYDCLRQKPSATAASNQVRWVLAQTGKDK